ncbi:VanZ family protein [Marinobacter salinisoli]|uniref:VanZ family protein n=1 Tax=Marinobacter salinisoli TaxID=2769486 RepID=A0ABX7MT06_9GAMM|nr:VanZ family protein [Marinobacter salinisoli]QSP95299.1 VanZ family protein [Marinobacter salinisoli]
MVALKAFVLDLLNCRPLWRGALLISLLAIAVLATTSKPFVLPLPGHDKLTHLLAFLELTILIRLAWPGANPLVYAPVVLAFGLAIEAAQIALPYRVFSAEDLLAGAAGVALGMLPSPLRTQISRTP